jgi:hypothetical protein
MLSFNFEVKRLVSTFLNHRNDIDIYTEDEEKDKEFYKQLLRKLIDQRIVINDVTPLGCRDNVIDRCKNEPNNGRKKLFIVDADINLINKKLEFNYSNLFVHDSYCIENLLFDEQSVSKFIYLQCAIKSKEQIENELDYKAWLAEYTDALISLFINFAIVDHFGYNFRLGNAQKYHVKVGNSLVFDRQLVDNDIESLKIELLKNVTLEQYEKELQELTSKWKADTDTFLKIASGKDYLIPILLIKTNLFKQSNSMPSLQEVKMLLLEFSDLFRFRRLKEVIEAL